jgi:type IV secretion system protein VirB10
MIDPDLLSPESSPKMLKKSGVRRVNGLPLMIALGALILFMVMIALVAVKRARLQNEPIKADKIGTESSDSLLLAKAIIGEKPRGIIPPANPLKESSPLPMVAQKPDLDPLLSPEEKPQDNIEKERIRQVKVQLFEEAIKAKTSIAFSQELHSQTPKHPSQQAESGIEEEGRWTLHSTMDKPATPYILRAGSVIPAVMVSGIRSNLPGQIKGQVSQNVYDTATGKYLLIPQGTQLFGFYSSDVGYGQNALLIAWQRLTFPDGKALDIGSMPGTDSAGFAGFRDQIDNHYLRVFGSAILMSGVVAGMSYSQNQPTNTLSTPSASNVLSEALGQQLGEVTAQMIAKNLNVAPDLKIRSGYRFNIMVVKDLVFKKSYKHFDYQ